MPLVQPRQAYGHSYSLTLGLALGGDHSVFVASVNYLLGTCASVGYLGSGVVSLKSIIKVVGLVSCVWTLNFYEEPRVISLIYMYIICVGRGVQVGNSYILRSG